ncbi:MAG: gamma-glutamylcyclotransferase [Burkholderiales bacterium]|nr:gamma-glutamylcyclotransferase [Burkholderiales bacterium]
MSKVDRSVLQADGVRNAVRAAGFGHLLAADAEIDASLQATMASHPAESPVWVFGYGSLIWNPLMQHAERRVARLHGYHRGFYMWSRINRGSPEVPGLVLGLDRGGSCGGVVYRLDPATAEEDLRLLWRREMVMAAYVPRWFHVATPTGPVRAIAFVVGRHFPTYAGRLTDAEIVAIARRAHGHYGSCAEYLEQTAAGLEACGIVDRRLRRLARLLQLPG